jgi:hypothetical protein
VFAAAWLGRQDFKLGWYIHRLSRWIARLILHYLRLTLEGVLRFKFKMPRPRKLTRRDGTYYVRIMSRPI